MESLLYVIIVRLCRPNVTSRMYQERIQAPYICQYRHMELYTTQMAVLQPRYTTFGCKTCPGGIT
jgi:hypothetical protein